MVTFISFLLVALAALLAIPVTVFFLEVAAAIVLPQRDLVRLPSKHSRRRVAVLVPAHNEGTKMLLTLGDIKAQMRATDHLLVVADNCTDDTAAIAGSVGADVVVRNDPDRKGKGYALAHGLCHLGLDPPDVVIIVDADCRLADNAIDRLEAACTVTRRPVQGLDLMIAPDKSTINFRVAEFAWRLKNWVRPLGLRALGLPCQLMGTGMAFPWDVILSADLANGSIVEDLKLGHDLALAGNAPVFCPFPTVTSEFPISAEAAQSQRLRWERGHIGTILTAVPHMIFEAVRRANLDLLAMALDVAVPPLSLLGMLVIAMSIVAGLAALVGLSSAAILITAVSLSVLVSGVILSWAKYGREILPFGAIRLLPYYVLKKLPLYRRIFSRESDLHWIRTDRRKE